jgi:uncharacterized protein YjeT (DUF2065 family)
MENAVERMTGLLFLVIGLSHLLRPREWWQFFALLRSKGASGAFINGMMSLWLGAIIVGFHGTIWSGWPAVVTFIGWGQLVKGTLHVCFPSYSLRSMGMITEERSGKFALAGGVMIPVALMILFTSAR